MRHQLAEVGDRNHFNIGHQRRFFGIYSGNKNFLQPRTSRQGGEGQNAFGVAGGTIQRQFANKKGIGQMFVPDLLGGG